MSKIITKEEFEKVLFHTYVLNEKQVSVCEALNISGPTVNGILVTFELMKTGQIDTLIEKIMMPGGKKFSARFAKLSAEHLKIDVPQKLLEAYIERDKLRYQKELPVDQGCADLPVESEKPVEKKSSEEQHNETVYYCRLLEELHKHNELMEQLMDVVIPKYIADLKDNLNINFDTVTQSLKRTEDTLEGIKINTRKRGL